MLCAHHRQSGLSGHVFPGAVPLAGQMQQDTLQEKMQENLPVKTGKHLENIVVHPDYRLYPAVLPKLISIPQLHIGKLPPVIVGQRRCRQILVIQNSHYAGGEALVADRFCAGRVFP